MLKLLAAVAIAVAVVYSVWLSGARAHDAPTGWAYGFECCSLDDCYQLKTTVTATKTGWLIAETGELIPYGDSRLHASKDEFFHRCAFNGGADRRAICLYVPAPAY